MEIVKEKGRDFKKKNTLFVTSKLLLGNIAFFFLVNILSIGLR